ncbi:MAG: hypothetical protein AAB726_03775 [Patescibacteria group bacterium]
MKYLVSLIILVVILSAAFIPTVEILAQSTGTIPPSAGSTGQIPSGIGNPLAGNVNSIFSFVTYVLENIVLPLGVVIVVFFVIYSGFLFVTAQGNADKLQDARQTFLWVVVGAAILLGSVVIAKAIQTTICKIVPNSCYSEDFVGPRL